MKKHVHLLVLLCACIILCTGCGILPTPTPTPTATPLPTDTPTQVPTNTATPRPSATANANALPPAISFALNKTQGARAMNFDFATSITALQDGKTTQLPGFALKGQDSTLNRHVTVSGTTSDTNEFITYEVIVFGDAVYVKGLTGIPGIDPQLWYALPAEIQASVRRLPTARALVASFSAEDFGQAKFQAAGPETIDGEKCTAWSAQDAASIQKIIGVTEASELKKQMGEIDSSELKVWTCADGYIHRIKGLVKGHSTQNPANGVTITLSFEMSQFDAALDIEPPADAKPFRPQAAPVTASPKASASGTPTQQKTPTAQSPTTSASVTPSPTPKS
ncbi:MAG: hypothetical protein HY741_25685 [Chloroflexi bacterium]|nr:hypothetical protein [Chloroflexota bacterium]